MKLKTLKLITLLGMLSIGTTLHASKLSVSITKASKHPSNTTSITTDPTKIAKRYLGTKYKFGGNSLTRGIDCSSFTRAIMKKSKGKTLPRTASQQASAGKHVAKKNLQPGDLVFFKGTSSHARISHVIYLGNDRFIHASSGAHKVTISKLSKAYYKKHYAGARRV